MGPAGEAPVAPRERPSSQFHISPASTGPRASPRGNLRHGQGRKPRTASRCGTTASWFSAASDDGLPRSLPRWGRDVRPPAGSAPPLAGARARPPPPPPPALPAGLPRLPEPSPGQGAAPPRNNDGGAQGTRTKLRASQNKCRARSWRRRKLLERRGVVRSPGRDLTGLLGPESLPQPPRRPPRGAAGTRLAFGAGLLLFGAGR